MLAKCAIFVDFDNVFTTLWELDREAALRFASEPGDWLQVLANTHVISDPRRWLVARCYLNPAGFARAPGDTNDRLYFSRFRPGLVRAGFEVIDCPAVSRGGKNAADIRMVVDALELLDHRTHFDEFVLASGDSDFTPLLQKLRAEDRRITIVSPGYLSAAYTSIADRIVGFEAITELLRADADLALGGVDKSGPSQVETEQEDSRAEFSSLIRTRYQEASAPLNLAALALDAARKCVDAKQSGWFGAGSFTAAVVALDLPNVQFSQHHMWDAERHQPPSADRTDESAGLPADVGLLARELDLPRIDRADWPKVFAVLAQYAMTHEFNLTEATRWCRDALAGEGVEVGRNSLAYVMRGAQFGGVRLDSELAPSPEAIGAAFRGAVLDRASSLGLPLGETAEEAIGNWLGVN
ncbi:NYN domain-containing protein [Qipengyuania qiaonensis]|uniref:NYN domain-containing protein n=1 Tax=Qipengyuania qiaonensis TaxID=2867240 RepID=A0ABS7J8S6_9SPHN|nr:NYN domain-containing protein [Qipengyuania qiaonensis]MBX7482053.1 NYN domain-containing protein [Qipengyuania qiaonensis]